MNPIPETFTPYPSIVQHLPSYPSPQPCTRMSSPSASNPKRQTVDLIALQFNSDCQVRIFTDFRERSLRE